MKSSIAENIRLFRKQKKLTQEQLAEAMGVTTGAVHKWEAGLSTPELGLIMDLADFFDVSVDILLGYKINDKRLDTLYKRVTERLTTMDPAILPEIEQALQKYPNVFNVVYKAALIFLVFSIGEENKANAKRALELFERSLALLPQNTDPSVGEVTIYSNMASAHEVLGEYDKAVEILKAHNLNGMFNDSIGIEEVLYLKKPDEAEKFLSEALIDSFSVFTNASFGISLLLCAKKEYDSALDLIKWEEYNINMLRSNDKVNFLSKIEILTMVAKAGIFLGKGDRKEATKIMRNVYSKAGQFDLAPDYSGNSLRFASVPKDFILHDSMGATAAESVETLIKVIENSELGDIWRKIKNNGN
ncbi:MAG: helix-turn-helix domain-containing protein [Lachnospiraceae bacterium]|nr:helix-turn-helix domain-containing protein [Lachnospiraceae bacterium]